MSVWPSTAPLDVLIIEPDAALAALLSAALCDEGYAVGCVAAPDDAVAVFVSRGRRAARLVLGPSSTEAPAWSRTWLDRLRAHTDAASVARVSLLACADEAGARLGASALLREPSTLDDLLNLVASLCARPYWRP